MIGRDALRTRSRQTLTPTQKWLHSERLGGDEGPGWGLHHVPPVALRHSIAHERIGRKKHLRLHCTTLPFTPNLSTSTTASDPTTLREHPR